MAKDRLPDKLAVILHADVAASTRLVQLDEHLAHERIQDSFRRFGQFIEIYRGKILELRGDALLAEFERASDATSATLAFQASQADYLVNLDDDVKPGIRVGIAMGEVVLGDGTVTGAGVILAQRIEQLAESGGLCITAALHEALPARMPFDLENIGEQTLSGFDEPVRVYKVGLTSGADIPAPAPGQESASSKKYQQRKPAIAAFIAVIVTLSAYLFFQYSFNPEIPLPDKPSIAVLPFNNMSDDAQQEFFADGMTEDLITDISKVPGLFVIARNSVFTYKGKAVKIRRVAEELGVRYVLEGSVRRVGDTVRINAQLIDATTGGHIWAERYDGSLADALSMQDSITRKIVDSLSLTLADQPSVATGNTEAYDAYLHGWERYRLGTPEDLGKAIANFERAIELDADMARAHSALAAAYWKIFNNQWWRKSLSVSAPQASELSRISLRNAMRQPSALAHQVASERLALYRNKADPALAEAALAITLDANDPAGHLAMSGALIKDGRAAEAIESIHIAMRLDPHYPASYLTRLGQAHIAMGEYEKAVESLKKAVSRNPDDDWSFVYLAAAHGQLGQVPEAQQALETANRLRARASWGAVTYSTLRLDYFKWLGDIKPLREGLIAAGMKPEANWSALLSSRSAEANAREWESLEIEGATKIDVTQAKALHERGVPFVDIYQIWWQKHIPGAHYLDWYNGEFNEASLGKIVNKNQEVVIYSSDTEGRTRGAQHCAMAVTYGFTKVYYLPEGSLEKWEKAGYPVETSTEYFRNQQI